MVNYRSPRQLVQIARCLMLARHTAMEPEVVAEQLYGRTAIPDLVIQRAAAGSHGTTGTGSELASPAAVSTEFADAVRSLSVLGRVTPVRVPFVTPLAFVGTRTTFDFVEERNPIPVTSPTFGTNVQLSEKKIAGIVVVSKELLLSSRGEAVLQAEMVQGCLEALDRRLLDPTSTETAARPASVTSAATNPLDATGAATPDDVDVLLSDMIGQLVTAGSTLQRAAFVTTPQNCASLALMRTTNGDLAYPNVNVAGGTIGGLPILPSFAAPAGGLSLIDGSEILLADEGGTEIVTTSQAMVEMDDAPDGDNNLVSLFQTESLGLKVIRFVNWRLRRNFVAYASGFTLAPDEASTA